VRSLSIVLQDADIAFSERELNDQQKRDLEDIDKGCRNVLDELERILDKYGELRSDTESIGKRIKRVWKRLKWEPDDIRELRDRITSNVTLLNTFLGRISRFVFVSLF
jgi:peptidoglycan hydrolase CwlO-like protein